ncbi:MAG: hypothetical protein JEZ02_03690 [Desulfatibacillum sp.]|nr:hypothetical protein [Desulfatibacillum sp.]
MTLKDLASPISKGLKAITGFCLFALAIFPPLALEAANIEYRSVWKPMHCQPVFSTSGPDANPGKRQSIRPGPWTER